MEEEEGEIRSKKEEGIREEEIGQPVVAEARDLKIIRVIQTSSNKKGNTMVRRNNSTEQLKSKDLNIKRRSNQSTVAVKQEASMRSTTQK
jgi:viroplasmin and RNaseH domain-containing protein